MDTNKHQIGKFSDASTFTKWEKFLGNKEFISTFWKLAAPSFLWGAVTAVVPLFVNLFSSLFFSNGKGGHSNLYISVNYTYDTISTVNYLVVSVLFAVFPAIGNFIGFKKFEDFRQTARFAIYVGLACCTVLMIFEEAFAPGFTSDLVYGGEVPPAQMIMGTNLTRIMTFISYAFLWIWLYIPSLSSIKRTSIVLWSAIISLVFFFIADPVYLHCLTSGVKDAFDNTKLNEQAAYGIGGIYLVYFMIQPIVVFFYLRFVRHFKYAGFLMKVAFIKALRLKGDRFSVLLSDLKAEKEFVKNAYYIEQELVIIKRWYVKWSLVKQVCKLAWGNIADQFFFNSFSIIHLVLVTNYGGYLPQGPGFVHFDDPTGKLAHHAGNAFYKTIYNIPSMLITFFYGIFNAFTVAPQYFVARELGRGNIKNAKRNAYICINWSVVMGVAFTAIIIIFAFFINKATLPASSGNDHFILSHHGKEAGWVTYNVVWSWSRNMMIIFSFILLSSTISNMTLYVVIQGASKYIILADTLGKVIFTVIAFALHFTHFDNIFAYYAIPHLDRLFQWVVYMIILVTGQCFNSIHTINIPRGKKHKHNKPARSSIVEHNNLQVEVVKYE